MRSFLAALVVACAACAAVPGTGPIQTFTIDARVPLRDAVGAPATVSHRSGPFELTKVLVRNPPDERELAMAKDHPNGQSHPKPVIWVRSTAQHTARVNMVSTLEDEGGKVFMTCKGRLPQELAPGFDDDWNTCQLEAMRTVDWLDSKYIHVMLEILVRGEAPVAAPPAAAAAKPKPAAGPEGGAPPACPGQPDPKDCGK